MRTHVKRIEAGEVFGTLAIGTLILVPAFGVPAAVASFTLSILAFGSKPTPRY